MVRRRSDGRSRNLWHPISVHNVELARAIPSPIFTLYAVSDCFTIYP